MARGVLKEGGRNRVGAPHIGSSGRMVGAKPSAVAAAGARDDCRCHRGYTESREAIPVP